MRIEISYNDIYKMLNQNLPSNFGVYYYQCERFRSPSMDISVRMQLQNYLAGPKFKYVVEAIGMNEDETQYKLEVRKS